MEILKPDHFNMKTIIEICLKIIMILLIITVFSACGSNDNPGVNETKANMDNETQNEQNVIETLVTDDLPNANFDGRTFKFVTGGTVFWTELDKVCVEESSGDLIKDAIYARTLSVEERFGVKIEERQISPDQISGNVRKCVRSGDILGDAVYLWGLYYLDLAAEGCLYNLNNLPNVDFSKPYYDQKGRAQLSVANRLYMMTGDANMYYNDNTWVLMFNKKLLDDYALDDPYKLVKDGKWTIDKMLELGKPCVKDVNGDGSFTFDDQYGMVTHSETIRGMYFASGERIFTKNSKDVPEFNGISERFVAALEKVYEVFNDYNFTFDTRNPKNLASIKGLGDDVPRIMFETNKALFCGEMLECVRRYRAMETSFGVLPLPKTDENQKEYSSYMAYPFTGVCVQSNISEDDEEFIGTIIEAMHSASHYTLIPAYFDSALYVKFMRDEESREMLEIILNNRSYPFSVLKDFALISSALKDAVVAGDSNFVSVVSSLEEKARIEMNTLIDAIESLQ